MPSITLVALAAILSLAASVNAVPAPSPVVLAPVWAQCGGQTFTGPTRCVPEAYCFKHNDWQSQCLPNAKSSSTPIKTTQVPTASPAALVPTWGQCGGWTGPVRCVPEAYCSVYNIYESQCLPNPKSSSTPIKTTQVPTASPAALVPTWGQCGGWTGPTRCVPGAYCSVYNIYESQCLPNPKSSSTPIKTTQVPTPSAALVPMWGQCGGQGWAGAIRCVPGAYCFAHNIYISQCLAIPKDSTTKPMAKRSAETLTPVPVGKAFDLCYGGPGWTGPTACEKGTFCYVIHSELSQCLPDGYIKSTSSRAPAPTLPAGYAPLWAQCGGQNFNGPTKCIEGSCVYQNTWHSQCLHVQSSDTSSSALPTPTEALQVMWGQCGGQGWTGPTKCSPGAFCLYSNQWHSQCLPISQSPIPTTTTPIITTPAVTTRKTTTSAITTRKTTTPAITTRKTTTPAITTRKTTTATTRKITTASPKPTPITPQVPLYGQCGGESWTGPTVCVPEANCVFQYSVYSQCRPKTEVPTGGQCGGASYSGPTQCVMGKASCQYISRDLSRCVLIGTPAKVRARQTQVAQPWGQCGGQGYTGPTKCPPKTFCLYQNAWRSQCLPIEEASPTPIRTTQVVTTRKTTAATTTRKTTVPAYTTRKTTTASTTRKPTTASPSPTPITPNKVPLWHQCGGDFWNGLTDCVAGSFCAYQNVDFSQCLPLAQSTTRAVTTTAVELGPEGPNQHWKQCGGRAFFSAKGCVAGLICYPHNEWMWQCLSPEEVAAIPKTTAGTDWKVRARQIQRRQAQPWGQCGGSGFTGPTTCTEGWYCKYSNQWHSQCLQGVAPPITSTTTASPTTTMSTTSTTAVRSRTRTSTSVQPTGTGGYKYLFTFGDQYISTEFNVTGTKPSKANQLGNPAFPGVTLSGGKNWIGWLLKRNPSLLSFNLAARWAQVVTYFPDPEDWWAPEFHPGFTEQVRLWESSINGKSFAKWTSSNALFGFWFTTAEAANGYGYENLEETARDWVVKYFEQAQILYNAGARHFVFLNAGPFQRNPVMAHDDETMADNRRRQNIGILEYNDELASGFEKFKRTNPSAKAWLVDVQKPWNYALDHPAQYGVSDNLCYDSEWHEIEVKQKCFFHDEFNPGPIIHGLIADAIANAVGLH